MKRILLILLNLSLCIQISAQTESCLSIGDELTKHEGVWTDEEEINYILVHKDSFDLRNEEDKLLYNWALGTRYYPLGKYEEALICLREVTSLCDIYGENIDLKTNQQLLVAYYWEAICEFRTGSSTDIILAKLKRAKTTFEKYNYIDNNYYNQILLDINFCETGGDVVKTALQQKSEFSLLKGICEKASLAMEYMSRNEHNEAIPLIEQIINSWPESLPKEELAPFCQFLGNSYVAVGRLKDAEQLYLNTLSELEEHHKVYRNICDALGVLYYQLHNYQKAKDFSGQSKWLHEKYRDFDDLYIRCLSNCALVEYSLGHNYIAKMLMDVAFKYLREGYGYDTSKQFANAMTELASITGTSLNVTQLSNNADKAFQLRPYILLLSNAAAIYREAGFWEDAVICIKECISMCEELGEQNGMAYNNLGTMYLSQNRISESLPYFEKAISLYTTDYEKNEGLFNYALVLWLSHSYECSDVAVQASKSLINSFAYNFSFLSQEEKYNYYTHFENYLPFINLMLYESGNENVYGCIYDNILVTKGLLLRTSNNIKETIFQSGDDELIGDYNRMIALRQQILTERDSILRIEITKEIESLDKRLSRNAADYGAFKKFNNTNWQDVQRSLNEDEIAIEFYNIPIILHNDTIQKIDAEPRYCAVILKKDYQFPKIISLCKESELAELDEDSLYCTDVLNRLIWKPLKTELKGIKNIYFSADRKLHHIAIEYALQEDGGIINNNYNIYRLSSTRLMAEANEKNRVKNAVLYGGLQYDLEPEQLIAESRNGEYHTDKTSRSAGELTHLRYGVKYLPGTKQEIEDIYKRFTSKKAQCDTITGIAGTEESFKQLASKNVGIIHLATHGYYWSEEDAEERNYVSFLSNTNNKPRNFEDRALLRSGLFFSGANIGLAGGDLPDDVEDGVLTAQELSTMNLGNVDMVVMSACQSGLGETSGEGVFGLQRGFKLAGANTLLMSLWKVDDEATKILMTEFYKNYLSGKTKRESLLLAQEILRKTHPEPEYWAGFILLDALD